MNWSDSVRQVIEHLRADGASSEVRVFEESVPTAVAAASLLGCEVSAIVNSLVFTQDEDMPLLILASGARRVDTAYVAEQIGAARVSRATREFVLEHTGQSPGGVAPVGHPHPIRTLLDEELLGHETVWAGGGDEYTMFATTAAELARLTDAKVTGVRP
ncbi:MAG: YbaK/EbsC family protein [Nocardioidaceae bacterium]